MGRDDLRAAFEHTDEDDAHAEAFAALLAGYLDAAADIARLGVDTRMRAVRLASAWRERIVRSPRPQAEWVTAPQVAARYGVTPQAVYKWIKSGRVSAEQTPGGSWRLRADQFKRA